MEANANYKNAVTTGYKEEVRLIHQGTRMLGNFLNQLDYEQSAAEFSGSPEARNDPDNRPTSAGSKSCTQFWGEFVQFVNDLEPESMSHTVLSELLDSFAEDMACAECGYQCCDGDDDGEDAEAFCSADIEEGILVEDDLNSIVDTAVTALASVGYAAEVTVVRVRPCDCD